ncbi:MAG: MOSC N-terminal beta barrel domain-containing protein [Planctomycetaceae bacterium]|nr:MOSC N-terminal beta barrel domain-containing protein [Planctomycetaceae bacterium]
MARLARVTIYPLKSSPGFSTSQAVFLPTGAIEQDRRFALVDSAGQILTAKRLPAFHRLTIAIDPVARACRFGASDETAPTLHIDADRVEIEQRLSEHLEIACRLIENTENGFPDDLDSPGPTLVSTATLEMVASWFPSLTVDEVRRRFRANLEVEDVPPFWEDSLLSATGQGGTIRLGDVVLEVTNPCQRCAVPSRDSHTGEPTAMFQKTFAARREATLPASVPRERFNHFYRLTANTRMISRGGGIVEVGTEVTVESRPV